MATDDNIFIVGLNHKRTPIDIREKLAFHAAELKEVLPRLRQETGVSEGLILSTCNRVEVYAVSRDGDPTERLGSFLASARGLQTQQLNGLLYAHSNEEAVRHLFEVASSLDSMVVGETQIIAQVKDAYEAAQRQGTTSRVLNPLFQRALNVAKLVHTATNLSEGNLSVSSVAAKLSGKIFDSLADQTLLIVGAGEMGEVTLRAFTQAGVTRVKVCNRTVEKARQLAQEVHGEACPLSDLDRVLPQCDIVIFCLDAEGYVLSPDRVADALAARRNKPMLIIDIAVPRNVNPEVNRLEPIYLFNIDDLQSLAEMNHANREAKMEQCREIVGNEVRNFVQEWRLADVEKVIRDMQTALHELAEAEANKTLSKLAGLDDRAREEVAYLAKRLVNKIMAQSIQAMKAASTDSHTLSLPDAVKKIFNLK